MLVVTDGSVSAREAELVAVSKDWLEHSAAADDLKLSIITVNLRHAPILPGSIAFISALVRWNNAMPSTKLSANMYSQLTLRTHLNANAYI